MEVEGLEPPRAVINLVPTAVLPEGPQAARITISSYFLILLYY